MRVGFIYDVVYPFVAGGVQRRNHALATRLRARHEVTFYGFRSWDEGGEGCLAGCRYVGVGAPVPLYNANGRRRLGEAVVFAAKLLLPLSRGREEVWDIANFPFFSIPVAWLVSRLTGKALVVTWHEFWGSYWNDRMGRFGFLGRLLERACTAMSPTIVTVSGHTQRRMLAAGVDPSRVHVVPNGIDVEVIRDAPPSRERSDVIWVGRLIPHKQADLAVRAFALLHRDQPTLRFVVVGDGPERGRLEALAADLGIGSAVRFAGFVDRPEEVYGLMKSSRLLLAPHRKEGFGITVVEGWACGLPAVVSRGEESALPELVDEPLKGRVADPSPEALAAACGEVLAATGPGERRALTERAACYDWEKVAEQLEEVYLAAIGRTRR